MDALPPRTRPRRITQTVQLLCPECGGSTPLLERGRVLPLSDRVRYEGRCEDCAAPLAATLGCEEFETMRPRLLESGYVARHTPLDVTHVVAGRVAGGAAR